MQPRAVSGLPHDTCDVCFRTSLRHVWFLVFFFLLYQRFSVADMCFDMEVLVRDRPAVPGMPFWEISVIL